MEENNLKISFAMYIRLEFSGFIFLQQLINIMCAPDTVLESESQNDDDTEQSTEVDGMIDVVYENETDDEANF